MIRDEKERKEKKWHMSAWKGFEMFSWPYDLTSDDTRARGAGPDAVPPESK